MAISPSYPSVKYIRNTFYSSNNSRSCAINQTDGYSYRFESAKFQGH